MQMISRTAPAVFLFFLAPIIAEYLLGDLTLAQFGAMFALAPLYGGGSILVRELVRRSQGGMPTFVMLALAYGIFEEGLLTQSLFNPDYLHLHLLKLGFIPELGTALPWAINVLGVHLGWSLAVPIGIAEASVPERSNEPWLKLPGLMVAALLFAAGSVMVAHFSLVHSPFRASPLQLGTSAMLVLALVVGAFVAAPGKSGPPVREIASPWLLGSATLICGSLFLIAGLVGPRFLPWALSAAAQLAPALLLIGLLLWLQRHFRSDPLARWGAAYGGMLCYAWCGYLIDRDLHGPGHAIGHSLFVVSVVLVSSWSGLRAWRARNSSRAVAAPPGEVALVGM
jgi:hypothetical protein